MHVLLLFISLFILFTLELVYLKIADRHNIIDHPNERSSHSDITIRGGGVIFVMAAIAASCWHFSYFYPALLGIILVGIISFLDDIYTLSNSIRILFHVISVSLLFMFLGVFSSFFMWEILLLYILTIGVINAYNFMDGINGMTGCYSFVILSGLQYVNIYQIHFINSDLIWLPMIACLVFLFFNFRKKAKCFAGDVGSITVALWIILLVLDLIFRTKNWCYILFLSVYGVESILTICHRLILRQNIFEAHRLHVYQLLVNERKMPHLSVSLSYALIQTGIIGFVILNPHFSFIILSCTTILPLVVIYLFIKPQLLR